MNKEVYTIEQIQQAADIATANAGINWEVLDSEPDARVFFVTGLQYGVAHLNMLEKVYKDKVLAYVDPVTNQLDTEKARLTLQEADILAEELYACYSMKGMLETYQAVVEITGGYKEAPPAPKKKRAPRKKNDDPKRDKK